MNETLNVIKSRRSVRGFKSEQIPKEALDAILEAALFAPSAGNRQPWHFTVIQDKAMIDELTVRAKAAIAVDDKSPYQKMAQNENFHLHYHAPTVIIVSGNPELGAASTDGAAAMQNILLAAESLGINSCWVNLVLFAFGGEEGNTLVTRLGIPEGYRPLYSAALGYQEKKDAPVPPRKTDCINYFKA